MAADEQDRPTTPRATGQATANKYARLPDPVDPADMRTVHQDAPLVDVVGEADRERLAFLRLAGAV